MSLVDLADNSRTDKNTTHSYLPLYQKLLVNKKETAKNVLEVGIFHGGSINLKMIMSYYIIQMLMMRHFLMKIF